jgi:hypothetical protein
MRRGTLWQEVRGVISDFRCGYWKFGMGWWPGSHRWFACGRDYYDWWWYGFRVGPLWASCSPWSTREGSEPKAETEGLGAEPGEPGGDSHAPKE